MTDDLRAWLALDDQRRALEDQVKAITTQCEQMRERILERWADEGVDSVRVDGRTVAVRRSVYARVLDRARLVPALRAAGLEDLLTANTTTLSAWIREREDHGEPLPTAFDEVIGTFERFSLVTRKR